MIIFAHSKCKRYENRKIQGVALPKMSGLDKNGKAPIMGRITVNRTMAQFSCKLSCTPSLWNPRASRLEGKSKEAVETNKDIDLLLLSIQKAFDVLVEKIPFRKNFYKKRQNTYRTTKNIRVLFQNAISKDF